ncbi:MAG TPA: hypothetical protein VG937_25260 [Polyangiaceae bacterium]|nr:hypothetical protein [Polyangiaceae bacterium]
MPVQVSNLRREGSAVLVDAKVDGASSKRYVVTLRRVGLTVLPSMDEAVSTELMEEIFAAVRRFAEGNAAVRTLLSASERPPSPE